MEWFCRVVVHYRNLSLLHYKFEARTGFGLLSSTHKLSQPKTINGQQDTQP